MKTIFYAAAALALTALVSCDNKEAKVDTTSAVPAKIINTLDETDLITSMSNSDSAIPAVVEAVPEDVADEINNNISEENNDKEQKSHKEKKSSENDGADDE